MGAFDYVKVVLDRVADMRWMQVAIKPAKPLAFGTISRDDAGPGGAAAVPVFGLPGNAVSSMVSFELFCRPGLRRLMGHAEPVEAPLPAVAAEPLRRRPDGKIHFVRVLAEPGPDGVHRVRSAGGQGSHQLWAMANAHGLAVLPDGAGAEPGDPVGLLLFGR
jgi:molybdopterin biosynthesis enzyme